jgi:hypothetical protein
MRWNEMMRRTVGVKKNADVRGVCLSTLEALRDGVGT